MFYNKIHQKLFLSVVTAYEKFRFSHFWLAFLVWSLMVILTVALGYMGSPDDFKVVFNLQGFIVSCILLIILMPIQTGWEEVFFRGYILQGSFKATQSVIWSLIISTCFFSLVHSTNPEVAKFGFATMQVYYLGAGLFLALLALVDNGLELSIGIHTATNLFGSIVLKYEGSVLQTETLFEQKMVNPWPMTISFYLCAIAAWWLLSKKYGFSIQDILPAGHKKLNKSHENPIT